MTETIDFDTVAEALALIDQGLGHMQHRNLVPTDEVSDLLLDVRMILASAEMTAPESSPDLEALQTS
ncbi:MAG: hypothetical protein V3V01_02285 [Acidimicrobiales bacterium]